MAISFLSEIFKKIMRFFASGKRAFFIDKATHKFIQHNKQIWGGRNAAPHSPLIIADLHDIGQSHVLYSYLLNALANKFNGKVVTYSLSFTRLFLKRRLRLLYKSFGVGGSITIRLNLQQRLRVKKILNNIHTNIISKSDLLELVVEDMDIGIDVYESYLRRYNQPTVNLSDKRLWLVMKEAVSTAIFWADFFKRQDVSAVVLSHDCYVEMNVLNKVAQCNSVPVYIATSQLTIKAQGSFAYASKFAQYRSWFACMHPENKFKAIDYARNQLNRRFSGEVGVDMHYSEKSAYSTTTTKKLINPSDNTKVLICSHCFYDNPHAYGRLFFNDFYEWLVYLREVADVTDYDWYLKTHPDPLPGTREIIQDILGDHSNIKLLPIDASNRQIADEGIDFVLTAYGSVGHEFPALGVPVINAGPNPHVNYNFNYHTTTLLDYDHMIKNLDKITNAKSNINLAELYEFYYMHYIYSVSDDFIYKSYVKMIEQIGYNDSYSSSVFDYFIDAFSAQEHERINRNVRHFLEQERVYSFPSDL